MTNRRAPRHWRPKAWTWLEQDAKPSTPHITVDPREHLVLTGGSDGEGRFVVLREQEGAGPTQWVGDRRHWTEVPPKPAD